MPQALGLVETKGLVGAIVAADAMLKAANVNLIGKEKVTPALITIKIIGETAAVKSAIEAGSAAASRVGQLISTHLIPNPDNQISSIIVEMPSEKTSPQKKVPLKSKETEFSDALKDSTKVEKPEVASDVPVIKRKSAPTRSPQNEAAHKPSAPLFEVEEKKNSKFESSVERLKAEALKDLKGESEASESNVEIPVNDEKENAPATSDVSTGELDSMNVHQLRKLARGVEGFPIQGREISKANRNTLLNYFKSINK